VAAIIDCVAQSLGKEGEGDSFPEVNLAGDKHVSVFKGICTRENYKDLVFCVPAIVMNFTALL
jgi:hypothetical protein